MSYPHIMAYYHGGHCCGITHIVNFPPNPTYVCDAVERDTDADRQTQLNVFYGLRFNYIRPRETAKERLVAVIRALSEVNDLNFGWSRRQSGILEVVLISNQKLYWEETLKELGFKEVNSSPNSNSGRMIHVFHKNTGA